MKLLILVLALASFSAKADQSDLMRPLSPSEVKAEIQYEKKIIAECIKLTGRASCATSNEDESND